MKAVVAAFNQEKALVGAFSVITNLRMDLFEALLTTDRSSAIAQQWVGANTNKRIYLEISTTCPADEVMTPPRPDMSAMVDYMFEYIN